MFFLLSSRVFGLDWFGGFLLFFTMRIYIARPSVIPNTSQCPNPPTLVTVTPIISSIKPEGLQLYFLATLPRNYVDELYSAGNAGTGKGDIW